MREFPGDPVVRIRAFSTGREGSILGQGTKIPHATRQSQKKKRERERRGLKGTVVRQNRWKGDN